MELPMKNKAIEAMMRHQYQIPESVEVEVEFLWAVSSTFTFKVSWWIEDSQYVREVEVTQSNLKLRHTMSEKQSFVRFIMQDPTKLVDGVIFKNQPTTTHTLSVLFNRDWNGLINDKSKPASELMDEAIVAMTINGDEAEKLAAGRGGCTNYNCSHCGGGLSLTMCSGCGNKFEDDHFRCGWYTPLSPKMVEYLQEMGHEFKQDPEVARQKELSEFKLVA